MSLGVSNITASNYIELSISKHLFYVTGVFVYHPGGDEQSTNYAIVETKEYTKGTRFLVVNLAGNYNVPIIIGVVE